MAPYARYLRKKVFVPLTDNVLEKVVTPIGDKIMGRTKTRIKSTGEGFFSPSSQVTEDQPYASYKLTDEEKKVIIALGKTKEEIMREATRAEDKIAKDLAVEAGKSKE